MGQRVITVKGKGSASAAPDWIKISMNLQAKDIDYQETVNVATKELNQLRKCLAKHGFDKKDIKTTYFNIDTDYENVRDTTGNYNRVFNGYICSQSLYVGFKSDSKMLGSILDSLSRCKTTPEFSIKYQLRDEKNIKEELLKNAVADAMYKVKVITTATKVNLGDIVRIDYDWSEIRFEREDFCIRESACEPSVASIDMEPDDIEVTDTVSIVWQIK